MEEYIALRTDHALKMDLIRESKALGMSISETTRFILRSYFEGSNSTNGKHSGTEGRKTDVSDTRKISAPRRNRKADSGSGLH